MLPTALIDRVKSILLSPQDEWEKIANEPVEPKQLLLNYVLILAAIPSICGLIGGFLFGGVPLFANILAAVASYVLAPVMVFVVAALIDLLGQYFGAQRDFSQSFKVAVYSSTPVFLAGIFQLLPLGLLGGIISFLASAYGIYLTYLGLQKLMLAPQDKIVLYTIGVVVASMLVAGVIVIVLGGILVPRP